MADSVGDNDDFSKGLIGAKAQLIRLTPSLEAENASRVAPPDTVVTMTER
jgi:hypothetical protein